MIELNHQSLNISIIYYKIYFILIIIIILEELSFCNQITRILAYNVKKNV